MQREASAPVADACAWMACTPGCAAAARSPRETARRAIIAWSRAPPGPAGIATMNDVLAACARLPELRVSKGATLIEEGVRVDRLYVVQRGSFEIVRGGVRLVVVREAGAFLGEMSAVLGSAPTASVVAAEDSVVHVLEDASNAVRT